jgi:asparagine synthase (glutamine-hydrolysing)
LIDARLDNRQELARSLGFRHSVPIEKVSDEELICAAYGKWSERCPEYLLGDFVVAIWDIAFQTLFLARDHLGIKPLYYHLSPTRLVFANDLRGIVAHPGVPRALNDVAVAAYLAEAGLHHPRWTFFERVEKLPPGTSVSINSARSSEKTFWRPEDSCAIRLRTVDEYREQLRWLLEESVRARIRSDYPVATHLSGGLDSSSIAVLAARMLGAEGRSLTGFNWVHAPGPNDDPDYFEWSNSRRIASAENIQHRHVEINSQILADVLAKLDITCNDTADLWYEHPLREHARREGIRVLLSGWGGDEFASYNGSASHTGLFWRGRVIAAITDMWQEALRSPRSWRRFIAMCYGRLLRPLSPSSWRLRLTGGHFYRPEFKRLLRPGIARLAARSGRWRHWSPRLGARADQLALYREGYLISRIESWAASGGTANVEYRYPLLDKPLVEFSLGIPPELYRQQGRGRLLFREAVSDLLPPDIASGNFKFEQQRVSRNVSVALEAYKIWADSRRRSAARIPLNPSGEYICNDRLLQVITKLRDCHHADLDEKIDLADGLGLVLLVAQMGNTLGPADRASEL